MIVVFGSINIDLIVTLDRLPRPGETVSGGELRVAPGGKGANQALAARRAGAPVRLVGCVGEDSFAAPALVLLENSGVDLDHVRRTRAPTGTALIMVEAGGENMIAISPGANGEATAAQLDSLSLGPGDLLLLQMELPAEEVAAAAARARSAGARVILNLAPYRAVDADLLANLDLLVLNEIECGLLAAELGIADRDVEAAAGGIARNRPLAIVVTLGGEGAVAFDGGVSRAPALPVAPVDTVGAGDTFVGYLAAGLHAGASLSDSLAWACAAGSLACLASGAQPSIPERRDVDRAVSAGAHLRASGEDA